MSARELVQAQCAGKRGFVTFTMANKVAKRLSGAHAYRCPNCHEWHVGSAEWGKKIPRRDRYADLDD